MTQGIPSHFRLSRSRICPERPSSSYLDMCIWVAVLGSISVSCWFCWKLAGWRSVIALDRNGVNPRACLLLAGLWWQQALAWSQSWRRQKPWPWWPCCCSCGTQCRGTGVSEKTMHCCGLKVKLVSFFFFRWNPGRGEYHRQRGAEIIFLHYYLGFLAGPSQHFATYGWTLHSQLILLFNLLPI